MKNLIFLLVVVVSNYMTYYFFTVNNHGVVDFDHLKELALKSASDLDYFRDTLVKLEIGEHEDLRKLLAAKADENLVILFKYGDSVKDENRLEYRSVVLREYSKFRERHPELYLPPTYLSAEEILTWKDTEKELNEYLVNNSALESEQLESLAR